MKEMETLGVSGSVAVKMFSDSQVVNEAKVGKDSTRSNELEQVDRGSKKKKGKVTGSAAANLSDSAADIPVQASTKSKKSQRRGKDISSSQMSDSKIGSRKESLKTKEENLSSPSDEWIMQKIMTLVPDFEEQCP